MAAELQRDNLVFTVSHSCAKLNMQTASNYTSAHHSPSKHCELHAAMQLLHLGNCIHCHHQAPPFCRPLLLCVSVSRRTRNTILMHKAEFPLQSVRENMTHEDHLYLDSASLANQHSQQECTSSFVQLSATHSCNVYFHQECFNTQGTGRTLFTK